MSELGLYYSQGKKGPKSPACHGKCKFKNEARVVQSTSWAFTRISGTCPLGGMFNLHIVDKATGSRNPNPLRFP